MKLPLTRSPWWERLTLTGLLLLALLLVHLTLWKENELFWREAGGYPLWLRQSVEAVYYPYLLFVIAAALALSYSVLARFFRTMKLSRIWLLLLLAWLVITGSMGLLLANNISNFINGRPLHEHRSH